VNVVCNGLYGFSGVGELPLDDPYFQAENGAVGVRPTMKETALLCTGSYLTHKSTLTEQETGRYTLETEPETSHYKPQKGGARAGNGTLSVDGKACYHSVVACHSERTKCANSPS